MSSASQWLKTLSRLVWIGGCGWMALGSPVSAAVFDAAAAFELRCSGCHSIGQGEVVGPDLKGVTERREGRWLHSFIRSSQSVIGGGDRTAVALFQQYQKRMPDHDLSDQDIDILLRFIASGGARPKAGDQRPAPSATAAEVAQGRDLFTGRVALRHGGAACAYCHTAADAAVWSGGTLASDLTRAYAKYQDAGLTRALAQSRFPLMDGYRERPLTRQEIFRLKAFLYQASRAPQPAGELTAGGSLWLGLERFSPLVWLSQWLGERRAQNLAE
jgi:mono/diheme cytochrome c family protein